MTRRAPSPEIQAKMAAVVDRLRAAGLADCALGFAELFAIVAPGVPPRRDGQPSREYFEVQYAVAQLIYRRDIEAIRPKVPGTHSGRGRYRYRLRI
jgi:hypothetical protein